MIGVTKQVVATTSLTALVFPEKGLNRWPLLDLLRITPTNASDVVKVYVPKPQFKVPLATASTVAGTLAEVPVDVASGHVVKTHTVTSNDFVLIPTYTAGPPIQHLGWTLKPISSVQDLGAAGETDRCRLNFSGAWGRIYPIGTPVYVIRAADVLAITAGGTSVIEKERFAAGYAGCPLVLSGLAAASTVTVQGNVYWLTEAETLPNRE